MTFAKRSIFNVVTAFVMSIVLIDCITTSKTLTQVQAQTQLTALSSLQADHIILRVPNFEKTMQWYGFRRLSSRRSRT
jgi:hypothetical protein